MLGSHISTSGTLWRAKPSFACSEILLAPQGASPRRPKLTGPARVLNCFLRKAICTWSRCPKLDLRRCVLDMCTDGP
eukprot:6393163-Pyramimonas_sp.AAC.1